jgi:hypothetical protein
VAWLSLEVGDITNSINPPIILDVLTLHLQTFGLSKKHKSEHFALQYKVLFRVTNTLNHVVVHLRMKVESVVIHTDY